MAVNDFEAEALIIARLKAQVPELALVCSLRSVAGAANLSNHLPAAVVEPSKAATEQQEARGAAAKMREHWLVGVVVQDTPDAVKFSADFSTTPDASGNITGELLAKVRQALQGWQPGPAFSLMQIEGRPEPTGHPGEITFGIEFSVLHSLEA